MLVAQQVSFGRHAPQGSPPLLEEEDELEDELEELADEAAEDELALDEVAVPEELDADALDADALDADALDPAELDAEVDETVELAALTAACPPVPLDEPLVDAPPAAVDELDDPVGEPLDEPVDAVVVDPACAPPVALVAVDELRGAPPAPPVPPKRMPLVPPHPTRVAADAIRQIEEKRIGEA